MPIGSVDWIEKGMLDGKLAVHQTEDDKFFYDFTVRNKFFHGSQPQGWIRRIHVSLDGNELPEENIVFILRDQKFDLSTVRNLTDIWWQIGEEAVIRIRLDNPIDKKSCSLKCVFNLSTLFFVPIVDKKDEFGTMYLTLEEDAELIQKNGRGL